MIFQVNQNSLLSTMKSQRPYPPGIPKVCRLTFTSAMWQQQTTYNRQSRPRPCHAQNAATEAWQRRQLLLIFEWYIAGLLIE